MTIESIETKYKGRTSFYATMLQQQHAQRLHLKPGQRAVQISLES